MNRPPDDAAAIQRRLMRLALAAPWLLTANAAAVAAGALLTVAQMLAAAAAVAAVFPRPGSGAALQRALAILAFVAVGRALCAGVLEWTAQALSRRLQMRLRTAIFPRLLALAGAAGGAGRTGEIVTTAMDGVERLGAFYRLFLPQAMATALVPLAIVAAVAAVDRLSALLLALTGPLIPVFMWLLGAAAGARGREQWSALTRLGGRFLDVLQGLPTLVSCGRADDAVATLVAAGEELRVRTNAVLRLAFLSGLVLDLAASLSVAVVAASVGIRLIEGWITFPAGLAVLLLTPEFYLPFRLLGQRHHAAMEAVAAAPAVFELLDRPAAPAAAAGTGSSRRQGLAVAFSGVSLAYPGAGQPAVQDIDFEVPAGSLTVLAGRSGAGKTTLLALLLRLVEPTAGRIRIGDEDAAAGTAADWRHALTFVPQRPSFLAGSILDNLRLARPGATLEEVREAARLTGADDFIEALPGGYETPLDDNAGQLSGGQRQRLAITRALLKPAPILLLDEPTAHLDAVAAAGIDRVVRALAGERTVVLATHRASTLALADQVVVLDDGRIVGRGTWDRLLADGSRCAALLAEEPEAA